MKQTRLFHDFIEEIWQEPSPNKRGERFERLLVQALPKIPQAAVAKAYLWKDLPLKDKLFLFDDDSAKDNGVDLVVKTKSDEWIAVQAKFWQNEVSTGEVDKFLSYCANLDNLTWRWIVTVSGWSPNVDKKMGDSRRVSIFNAFNEWGECDIAHGVKKHKPTPAQEQAIHDCLKGLQDHDRGRLTMACGSGKTLVSLKIAEQLLPRGGRVLYATSGIGLVGQTRREWLNQGQDDMTSIVVCSDKDAGKQDENALRTGEQTAPVTTNPELITNKINNFPPPPPLHFLRMMFDLEFKLYFQLIIQYLELLKHRKNLVPQILIY